MSSVFLQLNMLNDRKKDKKLKLVLYITEISIFKIQKLLFISLLSHENFPLTQSILAKDFIRDCSLFFSYGGNKHLS